MVRRKKPLQPSQVSALKWYPLAMSEQTWHVLDELMTWFAASRDGPLPPIAKTRSSNSIFLRLLVGFLKFYFLFFELEMILSIFTEKAADWSWLRLLSRREKAIQCDTRPEPLNLEKNRQVILRLNELVKINIWSWKLAKKWIWNGKN